MKKKIPPPPPPSFSLFPPPRNHLEDTFVSGLRKKKKIHSHSFPWLGTGTTWGDEGSKKKRKTTTKEKKKGMVIPFRLQFSRNHLEDTSWDSLSFREGRRGRGSGVTAEVGCKTHRFFLFRHRFSVEHLASTRLPLLFFLLFFIYTHGHTHIHKNAF